MRAPGRLSRRRTHPPVRGDEDLSVLIVRAADGDRDAEAAFVARTIDDVWRYCAHLVGPGQADDATQAAYVRALRSLHNFRGDSSPRTWLLGVARNTCLDEIRARGRQERILAKVRSEPAELTSELDASADYSDALESLEPTRREAFVLTQVLGLSYSEAAEVIGCPVGTIRSRVARARVDLLGALADDPLVSVADGN